MNVHSRIHRLERIVQATYAEEEASRCAEEFRQGFLRLFQRIDERYGTNVAGGYQEASVHVPRLGLSESADFDAFEQRVEQDLVRFVKTLEVLCPELVEELRAEAEQQRGMEPHEYDSGE